VTATDSVGQTTTKAVTYNVAPAGYYALTYDDGPNGTITQPILDELGVLKAKATFFLIGQNVAQWPDLVQEEAKAGMWLGDHTWDHVNIGDSTDTGNPFDTTPCTGTATATPGDTSAGLCPQYEVEDTALLIHQVTGIWPQWFRPPYGDYGPSTDGMDTADTQALLNTVSADLQKVDPLAPQMWLTAWPPGMDTLDWCLNDVTDAIPPGTEGCPSPQATVAGNVVPIGTSVQSGGIVEMHDSHPGTVTALPGIVDGNANRGLLPGKLGYTATDQPGPWAPRPPYHVIAVAP
jgi:peptidoglycan/xylan/chitin deacetylase (PgdA/CDA1 family)